MQLIPRQIVTGVAEGDAFLSFCLFLLLKNQKNSFA